MKHFHVVTKAVEQLIFSIVLMHAIITVIILIVY